MRSHFDAEGEIRGTDLLGALVALWREGASGTLQFSRSGATAGFDIAAGDVVRTASSDPRFDTAAILVRAGKLDQATLERLPVGEGGDRAAVALQTGVLTRREWRWGEKIRAVEVLSDLLTWLEGEYWFFRTGAQEASEFRLTIPRLVLELFLRSRDRNLVLHYLGGVDVPLARASSFDAEFPSFGLTADAETVVQLIDGERTAAEISSEAPAEAFAVEKLLAALVTLGLVHPEFAPGEAAPPMPAPATVRPPEPDESAEPEEAPAAEEAVGAEDLEGEDVDAEAGEEEVEAVDQDQDEAEAAAENALEPSAPAPPVEERRAEEPEPPAEPRRFDDDDAEAGPAGGSFEERVPADYDEYEDDEPEPGGEESGLGDQELDVVARERRDEPRYALDDERGAGEKEGHERVPPESTPADLLGLEGEGGAAPPSPFDRALDGTTGVGAAERPQPRATALWIWVLAALAVAVIALLLWRTREGAGGEGEAGPGPVAAVRRTATPLGLSATVAAPAEAAEPSPTPMRIGPTALRAAAAPTSAPPTPARVAASPVPSPVPTRAAPAARPTAQRPTSAPARAAAPTAPPSPRAAAGAASSRQTWVDRAERDRRRYVQEGKARFAIQLELACEVPSLVDAFQHDRGGSMWLLTGPFQGRTCFRVLWGRYATREEAARALPRAPSFFSTPRNQPLVVPVR